MSWRKLLEGGNVAAEPTSKPELDNLRSIVKRCQADAQVTALSDDARFVHAYDAVRSLSVMLVRAAGYRPKKFGGHHNTFLALGEVDPAFATYSAYFDSCRMKRNTSEYDYSGSVSASDAKALFETARKFAVEAEDWIKAHHPALAASSP
jgi:hypothetical protein